MSSATSGPPNFGPLSHSVERMRREFDRWLDAAIQQGSKALDAVGLRNAERQWSPLIDIVESPNEVEIEVDLPGVDPGLIDVTLAGNMLTIEGPRRLSSTSEMGTTHLCERMHGPFQRSIPMPASVTAEGANAEFKNGVLRLRLMKSEKARSLKINVRAEAASPHDPLPTIRPL